MSLEGDIRAALLDMSAVTALVGTGDSARIRPYKLYKDDDKSEEHIIIEVDDEEKANDLSGVGGLEFATVTIDCRAITAAQADALAEAVRVNGADPGTGLAGYSGAAFDAVLESQAKSIIPFDDASNRTWYVVAQEYTVIDTETT